MDTHVARSQRCIPRNSAHCLPDSPADACHFYLGGWGGGGGGSVLLDTGSARGLAAEDLCTVTVDHGTTGKRHKGSVKTKNRHPCAIECFSLRFLQLPISHRKWEAVAFDGITVTRRHSYERWGLWSQASYFLQEMSSCCFSVPNRGDSGLQYFPWPGCSAEACSLSERF